MKIKFNFGWINLLSVAVLAIAHVAWAVNQNPATSHLLVSIFISVAVSLMIVLEQSKRAELFSIIGIITSVGLIDYFGNLCFSETFIKPSMLYIGYI